MPPPGGPEQTVHKTVKYDMTYEYANHITLDL